LALIEKLRQAGQSADPEVPPAVGAHIKVGVQVLSPDDLAALLALHPQAFALDLLLT
jgi:hypothetical protein